MDGNKKRLIYVSTGQPPLDVVRPKGFERPLRQGQCPACRLVTAIRAAIPDGIPGELTEFVEEALLVNPARGLRILRAPGTAAQFAAALGENGLTLAEVTQSHLDAWLVELPSHRSALRAFVQWAAGHRYLGAELEVPAAASRERRAAMDDVERLQLARQLLRERADDPPARLAGVLVLLFGQFVTRLCLVELTAITVDDDGRVNIALSDTPLRLREPLAGLALRVADDAREQGSRWLFPSSQGNRPLSADRLRERLAQLGLTQVLGARNGALSALAAQLPHALIAGQLGLSIATAAAWSKAVGATRSDYAALRTTR